MPWPFEREYMQLALIAGRGGRCVRAAHRHLLGAEADVADGRRIGHLAFAGVAAGLLAGVWPIWTALVAAVAGAVVIEWLRSRGRTSGDLALAFCFYGGIALAVVLASRADAGSVNVLPYLFGSILTVTWADVRVIALLGVVIVATLVARWAGDVRDRPRRGVGPRRRTSGRRPEHVARRR